MKNKLTDNEIIKALECCFTGAFDKCEECPLNSEYDELFSCLSIKQKLVADLINRQKAEIFKLKEEVKHFQLKNSELFKMNNSIVEENDYIKSEIERLSKQPKTDLDEIIKSKAIKEFAERLTGAVEKARLKYQSLCKEQGEKEDEVMNIHFGGMVKLIDNLVEEMTDNTEPIKTDHKPKQGKWLINPDGYFPYCSECKAEPEGRKMTKFCPECGAYMGKP